MPTYIDDGNVRAGDDSKSIEVTDSNGVRQVVKIGDSVQLTSGAATALAEVSEAVHGNYEE